jgi:hypothetical protein
VIAALFVEKGGVYYGLPDVDPWDEARDARLYAGPWPVVAHPPCERWGRSATKGGRRLGDDDACFQAALSALSRFGGVIEHPADSRAWDAFGLRKPVRSGGWCRAGYRDLWACCVEQGHYGHRARKATWLLARAPMDGMGLPLLPELIWGRAPFERTRRMREATTEAERRRARRTGVVQNMSKKQRRATPPAFRDLLLSIARSALREGAPAPGAGQGPDADPNPVGGKL